VAGKTNKILTKHSTRSGKLTEPENKSIKMILSKATLDKIPASKGLRIPGNATLALPEKVLQFGTGVLLRGLPDFIINNANNKGIFNGRIVVVKSTATGGIDAFTEQDGLYTVCIRSVEEGTKTEENHIVTSISRVLTAATEWDEILACAANEEMEIIISNTTELGITLTKDNVHATPPQSFPGKLLAFLYQRFKLFNGDPEKGMIVIPTELIPSNADKLLAIVLELAHQNGLEVAFIDWLENANHFCNSLVDRIVPGKFSKEEQGSVETALGYTDDLMIMSESYALWAIQSASEKVKKSLSFADGKEGVVIAADIDKFRELKLRLLNGSHTFTCGLAALAGFTTVKEAMANENFSAFIAALMKDEIVPSITSERISKEDATSFAGKVLDRYRNPFIEHAWTAICTQYSSKMNMRNVALISEYAKRFGSPAPLMALGMAAHLLYMKGTKGEDGKYYATADGTRYLVNDENAAFYSDAWKTPGKEELLSIIFGNKDIWQADLAGLNGFTAEVTHWLNELEAKGAKAVLEQVNKQKTILVNEK
jgi:tagaturonate reductase